PGIGHDRRRIRVDEDDAIALLFERLAGLRPGIIELAGLADDDRSGADDEDALDVGALRHGARDLRRELEIPSRLAGEGDECEGERERAPPSPRLLHQRDEALEEIVAVLGAGARLGVILHREDRLALDAEPLIAAVEEREMRLHDISGQALRDDGEAVILAGDLDLAGLQVLDR